MVVFGMATIPRNEESIHFVMVGRVTDLAFAKSETITGHCEMSGAFGNGGLSFTDG